MEGVFLLLLLKLDIFARCGVRKIVTFYRAGLFFLLLNSLWGGHRCQVLRSGPLKILVLISISIWVGAKFCYPFCCTILWSAEPLRTLSSTKKLPQKIPETACTLSFFFQGKTSWKIWMVNWLFFFKLLFPPHLTSRGGGRYRWLDCSREKRKWTFGTRTYAFAFGPIFPRGLIRRGTRGEGARILKLPLSTGKGS